MRNFYTLTIIIGILFVSCTRTNRIGHTRYHLGTAEKKQARQTHQAQLNRQFAVTGNPMHSEMPGSLNQSGLNPEESKPVNVPVLNPEKKSKVLPGIRHEALHLSPPDSLAPVDTATVLSESSRLLRIANISYTVNVLSGLGALVFYVLFLAILLGAIFGTVSSIDLTIVLLFLSVFALISTAALITWIVSSILFWFRYGKNINLIRSFVETRNKYIYHLVTLILTAIAALTQLAQLIYLAFQS